MPLSVAFRWKTPFIQAPQTDWEKNKTGENIITAANAIRAGLDRKREHERQDKLDQWAEDDRTQRLADEQRKRNVYQQVAESIRGRKQERDQLVAEAEQIKQQIAMLKQQYGG